MRAKLVTLGITAVATLALVVQASPQAVAQNTNKPAAKKKSPPPPPPKPAPAQPAPPAEGQTTMAAKPKPKPKKKAAVVPKGVPGCVKQLTQLAAKDPLIDYYGRPSSIVNDGLMWNSPQSRCSVGDDEAKKKKVVEIADAWRRKDGATVRSLLAELAQ
jgi:hypothetical protein